MSAEILWNKISDPPPLSFLEQNNWLPPTSFFKILYNWNSPMYHTDPSAIGLSMFVQCVSFVTDYIVIHLNAETQPESKAGVLQINLAFTTCCPWHHLLYIYTKYNLCFLNLTHYRDQKPVCYKLTVPSHVQSRCESKLPLTAHLVSKLVGSNTPTTL